GKSDAQHKHEVEQHDQPIDGGEVQHERLLGQKRLLKMENVRRCNQVHTTLLTGAEVRPAKFEKVFMHAHRAASGNLVRLGVFPYSDVYGSRFHSRVRSKTCAIRRSTGTQSR